MPSQNDSEAEKRFEQDRLDSPAKNREFEEALKNKGESFKSFSEGMAAVDKFDIVGLQEDREERQSQEDPGDSFSSFSEGLETVDKFEITGESLDDSYLIRMSLKQYLGHEACVIDQEVRSKSRTVREILERLERCAWFEHINLCLHKQEYPAEYDRLKQELHLDLTRNEELILLDLIHQLYHAAHRYLGKFYGAEKPLALAIVKDTLLWSEAGALLAELNTRRELALTQVPETGFKVPSGKKLRSAYVATLLAEGGSLRLRQEIEQALSRDDFLKRRTLEETIDRYHQRYLETFEEEKEAAKALITASINNGLAPDKI
ncbi:MAG TPA: hypothetical protein PKD05_24555 [Candidatus Melainabacteria bacterium]|nr:hypothetical protein [Candidatus Melainabacteria bacterium]HMP54744.1 hypothetical protein [Candidatus Melainabacteria bacterium]